jgi:propanediol dehydratase small subunit
MPDYPLAEKAPERLKTPSGLAFQDITLEAVLAGEVEMRDLRVTSEALELQAQVADEAGRPQLAENLRRAAELVDVPEDRILEVYKALRPGRGSRQALFELADDLENRWQAKRCAALVREAAR